MNNTIKLIERKASISSEIPIIAITGICKNAGKTTFLNWLSSHLAVQGPLALLTTGRDGEDYDLVGGHEKPKVVIKKGSLFVTHSSILERFSGKVEILLKSDFKAGPFDIWIARALQDLETEIIGPSTANEQISLAKQIKAFKPNYIIIDGSLDRKAITLKAEIDVMILVVSANYGSLDEIIAELNRLLLLTKIEQSAFSLGKDEALCLVKNNLVVMQRNTLLGFEKEVLNYLHEKDIDQIYIPGVVTDQIWDKIKNSFNKRDIEIIISHPYQLQLSYNNLKKMLENNQVKSINKFKIDVLALNSFSVKGRHIDAKELVKEVERITDIPLLDCMEVY